VSQYPQAVADTFRRRLHAISGHLCCRGNEADTGDRRRSQRVKEIGCERAAVAENSTDCCTILRTLYLKLEVVRQIALIRTPASFKFGFTKQVVVRGEYRTCILEVPCSIFGLSLLVCFVAFFTPSRCV
jgi:hypothetical protein